jgi:exonuclease III
MIVTSINIRGLGGRVKKRRIRDLVREQNVSFLAIQETKLEAIFDNFCYSLWGSEDCSWAFVPAEGASGGMLSLWSKSNSDFIFPFRGMVFLVFALIGELGS